MFTWLGCWVWNKQIHSHTDGYRQIHKDTDTYRQIHKQTNLIQTHMTYIHHTSKYMHCCMCLYVFFLEIIFFHEIHANASIYIHIQAYTSKYKLQYLLVFKSYVDAVCVCMCVIYAHMLVLCLYFLQPKPLVVKYKQNTSI